MAFYSTSVLVTLLAVTAFCGSSWAEIPVGGSGSITRDHFTALLRNREASLGQIRNPLTTPGSASKNSTRAYLKRQLTQIASQAGQQAEYYEQTYNTSVFTNAGDSVRQIDGVNYIVVYKGSIKQSDDEPLVIIANYDTDVEETNPIDDNGSGVAALIVIADVLAKDIANNRVDLKRTVILIASDTSLQKYEHGKPTERSIIGANEIARKWLPNFLDGRKSFRGAIVLDNIMTFSNEPRSQTVDSFSKSFPDAYKKMSESGFKGDFLALVHRDDKLDKPLAAAFERGWAKALKQTRENEGDSVALNQQRLIKFPIATSIDESEAVMHFLRSDQTEFWSHSEDVERKLFPAILLTDTEKYRKSPCPPTNGYPCPVETMLSNENVDFLRRVTMSVYETTVSLQGPNNSGVAPTFSLLAVFAGILLQYAHAFNF